MNDATCLCDDCGRLVPADRGQVWPPFWVCFDCVPKRPVPVVTETT